MNSKYRDSVARIDTPAKEVAVPVDSAVAQNKYDSATLKQVDLIRNELTKNIFRKKMDTIPADQRKFRYEAVDLNGDKKKEIFVSPVGNYFCVSGECTAYLLNYKGKLINTFKLTDFPIYTAETRSGDWYDLIVESGSKYHLLKWKNGKYPTEAAKEQVYNEIIGDSAKPILNITDGRFPIFAF